MKKCFIVGVSLMIHLFFSVHGQLPTVSIITSLYKGDDFIEGFMKDIVSQTIFNDCELILINANSPGNEEKVIRPYLSRYKNIVYRRLSADPGIYGTWNIAIKMARGKYITNANVDDRLRKDCYELHRNFLDNAPDIDLVYSDNYITTVANETFDKNSAQQIMKRDSYSLEALKRCCLPSTHPMWRKNMHSKYGLFDETYNIAGDWEMWLRAATQGSVFAKLDMILGLYYLNPKGLSSDPSGKWKAELHRVLSVYRGLRLYK